MFDQVLHYPKRILRGLRSTSQRPRSEHVLNLRGNEYSAYEEICLYFDGQEDFHAHLKQISGNLKPEPS